MARSYSDPSYGSRKNINLGATGSVVGTHGSGTELGPTPRVMDVPITVLDWSVACSVAGTHTVKSLVLATKLAGTGALVNIGTIALGTDAIGSTRSGSATSTDVAAGDELVVGFFGTDAIISQFEVNVTYKERFVQSDS